MNRNFGLDVMRAVAISLVLLCHFAKITSILGSLGVDVFFALSGFLIGGLFIRELYSHPENAFGFAELYRFLRRRWYRTLPNYYLFLLLYCAIEPMLGRSIPHLIWRYPLFLQNLYWPMSGFFFVSWSLGVEEWFYLIFPSFAMVLLRVTKSRKWTVATTIVVMILIPTVFRLILSPRVADWTYDLSMVVLCRLDALMYGVLMAWLKLRRPQVFSKLRVLVVPAVLTIVGMIFVTHTIDSIHKPSETPALVLTILPIACAALLPAAYGLSAVKARWETAVTSVSLWSYSIYLSHRIILDLAYHFTDPIVHSLIGKMLVKFASLTLTLFLSKIVYERFEIRVMKLRDRYGSTMAVAKGTADLARFA